MSRLIATLKLDVQVQARSQLYAIGVAVAVAFGLVGRYGIPEAHIGRGLVAFYVIGLGGTTFMYGASMLLLERGERTLEALQVSMIRARDYVASKALTLTAFAMFESAIVFAIASRGVPAAVGWLILGSAILGVFYTLCGVGLAAGYDSVTGFLFPMGALVGMVLQLSFLSLLGVGPWWLWYAIPTQAPLLILQAAFEPISGWQWAYAVAMSTAMLVGAWVFCLARFRTFVRFPEA